MDGCPGRDLPSLVRDLRLPGTTGVSVGFVAFLTPEMASACRINAEMASGQMTCMALEFSTGFRSISIRHRRLFVNIFNSTMM